MAIWEYQVIKVNTGGLLEQNVDKVDDRALNAQGAQGWELTAVFSPARGGGKSDFVYYYYKRIRGERGRVCDQCREAIHDDAVKCPHCGSELSIPDRCAYCNVIINQHENSVASEEGVQFCGAHHLYPRPLSDQEVGFVNAGCAAVLPDAVRDAYGESDGRLLLWGGIGSNSGFQFSDLYVVTERSVSLWKKKGLINDRWESRDRTPLTDIGEISVNRYHHTLVFTDPSPIRTISGLSTDAIDLLDIGLHSLRGEVPSGLDAGSPKQE